MTYMCKEFQIKTNMAQEQLIKLKVKLLLGYNMKIVI